MIVREEINDMIYIEQTTFYVYPNKEALRNDRPFLITSDKRVFDKHKDKEKFIESENSRTNVTANVVTSK